MVDFMIYSTTLFRGTDRFIAGFRDKHTLANTHQTILLF